MYFIDNNYSAHEDYFVKDMNYFMITHAALFAIL